MLDSVVYVLRSMWAAILETPELIIAFYPMILIIELPLVLNSGAYRGVQMVSEKSKLQIRVCP